MYEEIEKLTKNRHNLRSYEERVEFCRKYSWAIPSPKAIGEIKDFANDKTILEVGSGLGLWAKLLQDAGANIIPTDQSLNPAENHYVTRETPFTRILKMTALEAIRKNRQAGVLMMIWPPYDNEMASKSLTRFRGSKLVYVGEDRWGCTADKKFFQLLDRNWNRVEDIGIPQWEMVHDYMSFWERI